MARKSASRMKHKQAGQTKNKKGPLDFGYAHNRGGDTP
jgi:hypothetical protein